MDLAPRIITMSVIARRVNKLLFLSVGIFFRVVCSELVILIDILPWNGSELCMYFHNNSRHKRDSVMPY